MQSKQQFAKGESVIHAGKPEWGPGDVVSVSNEIFEGKPVQRLTIRFARAGLKTITTAFADLRPARTATNAQLAAVAMAPDPRETSGPTPSPERDPLSAKPIAPAAVVDEEPLGATFSRRELEESLQKLPEAVNDAFQPLAKRVEATLAQYKALESSVNLLAWATAQTGLRDPLAVLNRHELEAQLDRFRIRLDEHLRKLVRELRKENPVMYDKLASQAGPAAKQALRRVNIGR